MKLPNYYIEKPDYKEKISIQLEELGNDFNDLFQKANSPIYLPWKVFKHKVNLDTLSAREAWFFINQLRGYISISTPIRTENNTFFKWIRLPYTDEYLNKIDLHVGGNISSKPTDLNSRLIVRGIMEEAIASSQLEGAHTTRSSAKKMILEKKQPRNNSEQMILNNYRTIMAIEAEYKHSELSMDLMFELHKKLTDDTDAEDGQGRLRNDKDEIVVSGQIGNEKYITHVPPKEKFLKSEMQKLIDYANDKDDHVFTHPIIKAIFIHFWIGYLHPFTDGNGRIARSIFYWYLLRKNYWAMIYLPISTIIKKAPSQYSMAYINSEQNHFDITYFYDFHMRKIIQSLDEFKTYVATKEKENKNINKLLAEKYILNERQKRLLFYLLSDKDSNTTVSSHAEINSITRQTAAKDLQGLVSENLLVARREGQYIKYYATEILKEVNQR